MKRLNHAAQRNLREDLIRAHARLTEEMQEIDRLERRITNKRLRTVPRKYRSRVYDAVQLQRKTIVEQVARTLAANSPFLNILDGGKFPSSLAPPRDPFYDLPTKDFHSAAG
jgi:hypothetical protein